MGLVEGGDRQASPKCGTGNEKVYVCRKCLRLCGFWQSQVSYENTELKERLQKNLERGIKMKGIRDGRVAVAALLWMVMVPAAVVFGWTEMAEPAFAVEESVGQSDMTGTGKICVIVEPSGHGTVNGSDEAFEEKVAIGGDLVLKLQADDGYVIGKVLVNGASLDASDLMGLQGAESGELKLEDLDEEVNLRIGFMTKEDYAAFQDKAEETIDEIIDEMEEKLKITDPQPPEGSAQKAPQPIVSKEDEGAADGETVRVGDANDGKAGSDDGDDDAEDANDDDAEDAVGDDDDGSGDDETDAGDDDESGDEEADAGDDDEPDDEDADDVDDESGDEDADDVDDESGDDDADDEDAVGDDDDESGDADDEDADGEDADDEGVDDDDDEMTDDDDGSSADDEDADDDDAAASGDDEDNDDDEHSADGTGAGGTNDKNDETSADDADNVDDADDEKKAGDGKNETGENDDKNTSPIDDDADGARAGGVSDETGSGGSGNKNDAVEVDDSLEDDDDELLEDDAADAAADLDMTETTVQAGAGTSDSLGSSGSPKTGDAIPLKDLLLAAAGMTLSGLALAGTSGAHFFRRRRNQ